MAHLAAVLTGFDHKRRFVSEHPSRTAVVNLCRTVSFPRRVPPRVRKTSLARRTPTPGSLCREDGCPCNALFRVLVANHEAFCPYVTVEKSICNPSQERNPRFRIPQSFHKEVVAQMAE